jgi:hypothetical protein
MSNKILLHNFAMGLQNLVVSLEDFVINQQNRSQWNTNIFHALHNFVVDYKTL